MPILTGDIKLVASQVMLDVAEGGGAPTANVIQDATSNAIFPDISELDRAGGRVNLRKVHVSVQTPDTDTYLGSNVIVADPPSDPNVSVTLFSTKEVFDRRDSAKKRVEAYLAPGPAWAGFLFENHIIGQRSIQLFQMPNSTAPAIGHTILIVQNEGISTEKLQYVRVTRTASVLRTFIKENGQEYKALVVTADLSDALRFDFIGSPPSEFFRKMASAALVRDTTVADAAQYFGVVPLTEAVSMGSLSAKAKSIFTQLVPSAQTEIPVIDANAAGEYDTVVDASNGFVSITTSIGFNPNVALYFGNPIFPGTLNIAYSGGALTDSSGDLLQGTTVIGTVDYARGTATLAPSSPSIGGSKTITYKAAGAPLQLADSAGIFVSQETRAYNYIQTISPPPAPATTRVSYRSNGKWYDLRDNGGGKLVGSDVAYGAGTVSYVTGTVAVTLGALPDVGGEIILNWGSRVNYINRASATLPPLKIPLQLAQTGITPGTVVIKWNDGTARTATDDGKGNITGSATGSVRYQTGLINLEPTLLPAGGQIYTVDYAYGPPDVQEFPAPLRDINGNVPLTLSKANLRPNTVEVTWNLLYNPYDPVTMTLFPSRDPYKTVRDNGQGRLKDTLGADYGTVDYVTGIISLKTETTVGMPRALYAWVPIGNNAQGFAVRRFLFQGWEYFPVGANMPNDETAHVSVKYRTMDADSAISAPITTSALKFDLTNQYSENIVPGSVNFTLGGRTYFDRAGNLYYSLDVATGNAIKAGTLNYQSGEVTLDAWATAASSTVSVKSLLTSMDGRPVDEVTFRAPVAPLRTGSVQVLATRLAGGLINVSANTAGDFVGTDVSGHVDYDTGVVRLRFGSVVTAAGNETQVWYSAANVGTDGKVFKPAPVFANTIRFNAVGFTYLPLDADILGLDPVRLPQDGKVSIFRPGGFAVLGHTASVTATVSNGQVINCARVRLSRVRVIGADGQVINTGYTADLEAGRVTFTSVSGYVQPVTIEHRIEDMVQVSDVQINGQLAFTRQVTHTYPFPGSFISSALVAQDLKARVSVLFDQATWDSVTYADAVTGSVAPGTYNDILAPLIVTNKGAVTEKWALRFTNTTTFDVIGEHVGTISSGTIATDTSPLNPATGSPYFTIRGIGWGSGWAVGNVLRFNTVGALFPVWIVRTIQQGPESVINDKFTILVRGDVDRP
jgi:hypothetical protein